MLITCRITAFRSCASGRLATVRRGGIDQLGCSSKRRVWTGTLRGGNTEFISEHKKQYPPQHLAQHTTCALTRSATKTPPDVDHDPYPIKYAPDSISYPPTFKISPSTYQDALEKRFFWSYDMYRHISTGKTPLRHYCKTREQTEQVAKLFLEDGATHLGFDMEWAPGGRSYLDPGMAAKTGVSMIQLASESRIAIFHLALHTQSTPLTLIPPTSALHHILTAPHITKLGVAIAADMTRLTKHYPHITPHSHFELSHLYKTITYPHSPSQRNKRLVSLADLVETMFGLPLSKDQDVRGSDWSRPVTLQQTNYAASDAYAGVMLFRKMDARRKMMDPVPNMPLFVEFARGLGLGEEFGGRVKGRRRKGMMEEAVEEEVVVGDEAEGGDEAAEDFATDDEDGARAVKLEGNTAQSRVETGADVRSNSITQTLKMGPSAQQMMSKEKMAALARRNAYLRNMYQRKLK